MAENKKEDAFEKFNTAQIEIRDIKQLDIGSYLVPTFEIDNGLKRVASLQVDFVRGTKDTVQRQTGVTIEGLLSVCIKHLDNINQEVPHEETLEWIEQLCKIQEGFRRRAYDRFNRGVIYTKKA